MGTRAGGLKAAQKIKEKHGDDFFRIQGAVGGFMGNKNKGFRVHPELTKTAGAKGGSRSRYGYKLIGETKTHLIYLHKATNKQERVEKKDEYAQS